MRQKGRDFPSSESNEEEEQEWEVSAILNHRSVGESTQFQLKWATGEITWEDRTNLTHASELLQNYMKDRIHDFPRRDQQIQHISEGERGFRTHVTIDLNTIMKKPKYDSFPVSIFSIDSRHVFFLDEKGSSWKMGIQYFAEEYPDRFLSFISSHIEK
jgi:hypothetical protein